jgi:hypothetical protein
MRFLSQGNGYAEEMSELLGSRPNCWAEGNCWAKPLSVRGTVFLRDRGLGADLLDFEAKVIDPLHEACIVVSVGGPHRLAVERKVFKVVEWYRAEADLREQGLEPLLTASELWNDFRRVRMAS